MYPDNNWYGHRKILANYCEVKDKEIAGSIQHGVHITDYEEKLGSHMFFLPKYFCWERRTYEHCLKNNIKNIIPIGAPFIYLDKQLKKKNQNISDQGTLAFPAHSNPNENRYFKHKNFIEYVMKNFPPPYTVSLFFIDYKNETKKLYTDRGWKAFTAGDRANLNFLENVYNQISKHEYCIVTELGSALFYSLYLNKKCSYKPTYKDKNLEIPFSSYPLVAFYETQLKNYEEKNKFLLDKIIDAKKGKELADFELGKEFLKEKKKLKKILGFDNFYKSIFAYFFKKIINLKHGKLINWK